MSAQAEGRQPMSVREQLEKLLGKKAGTRTETSAEMPGGHHFYCVRCAGFRTHAVDIVTDRGDRTYQVATGSVTVKADEAPLASLIVLCRSCGEHAILVRRGDAWWPRDLARVARSYLGWRTEKVVYSYLEAIERGSEDQDDGEEAGRESGGSPRSADGRRNDPSVPAAAETAAPSPRARKRGPRLGTYLIMRAAHRQRHPMPARTKWKIASWAAAVPFAVMGALYLLAWNGVYVWPIYYALQPYWQPWMNDWRFAGLGAAVPVAIAVAYAIRFRPMPALPDADSGPTTDAILRQHASAAEAADEEAAAASAGRLRRAVIGTPRRERPDWWGKE